MMEVRRLAWAGLEISAGGEIVVVDFVEDFASLHGENPPLAEIPPSPAAGSVAVGLLTHLHSDHADISALGRALSPGGTVLRPRLAVGGPVETALVKGPESALAESGLEARIVEAWETVEIGPFSITALPAVDGFGDAQVSWSIAAESCRILHAGDTLFHGWWWQMALRHGPFDIAFLPAGGAIVDLPARQPASPFAAGMDPRQAVVATNLLGAGELVPIHYGPLHIARNYVQVDDPPGSVRTAAEELGVTTRLLQPGERFRIDPS